METLVGQIEKPLASRGFSFIRLAINRFDNEVLFYERFIDIIKIMDKINIYIDGNNLYRSAKELGYEIDYKKFRVWLSQKYNTKNIFLFIGYLENIKYFYIYLKNCGFNLIFKKAILHEGNIKGNCDAELVLKSVDDYHLKNFNKFILISNDGDFGCLIEFLINKNCFEIILSPDIKKCSILLRNKTNKILYLNEIYKKFSKKK